ncbi:MAG: rhamnulokinase, partial [Verrucomicrobiota bacterium]
MRTHYLAIDLGAESGRVMLGTLDGSRLSLEELHRFPNQPINANGSFTWDIDRLFIEVKTGLRKAADRKLAIHGISTDSWGVDYLLFDAGGAVMPPAFHYRDARTALGVKLTTARISREQIFDETGIQFMPLNTLFQLATESSQRLANASVLLTIADGFNFMLCNVARIDESNASTTQIHNPRTRRWSEIILDAMEFPKRLFPPVVPCGAKLGPLRPELVREIGLPPIDVIASCSHDTAAAVAAVPVSIEPATASPGRAPDWAYLSSGTWSLMGVEILEPLITPACRRMNFTNEIGHGGTVRLLKNIVGLWLVQECRREWALAGRQYDYADLARLAEEAAPFVSFINPADPRFIAPGDMPQKIALGCRE